MKKHLVILSAYFACLVNAGLIICITYTEKYDGSDEAGVSLISQIPFYMLFLGISGIILTARYLKGRFELIQTKKAIVLNGLLSFPVIFLSCLSLYAAAIFLAWI